MLDHFSASVFPFKIMPVVRIQVELEESKHRVYKPEFPKVLELKKFEPVINTRRPATTGIFSATVQLSKWCFLKGWKCFFFW